MLQSAVVKQEVDLGLNKDLAHLFLRKILRKSEWHGPSTRAFQLGRYIDANIPLAVFPCGCPSHQISRGGLYSSEMAPTSSHYRLYADTLEIVHLKCRRVVGRVNENDLNAALRSGRLQKPNIVPRLSRWRVA